MEIDDFCKRNSAKISSIAQYMMKFKHLEPRQSAIVAREKRIAVHISEEWLSDGKGFERWIKNTKTKMANEWHCESRVLAFSVGPACIVIDGIYWLWLITFRFIRIATLSQCVFFSHSVSALLNNHRHCFALLSYRFAFCSCFFFSISFSVSVSATTRKRWKKKDGKISIMFFAAFALNATASAWMDTLAKAANANNYIKVGR